MANPLSRAVSSTYQVDSIIILSLVEEERGSLLSCSNSLSINLLILLNDKLLHVLQLYTPLSCTYIVVVEISVFLNYQ